MPSSAEYMMIGDTRLHFRTTEACSSRFRAARLYLKYKENMRKQQKQQAKTQIEEQ